MGNYAAVVLADKPSRYYRLGEASGTTAYDQSNNLSNGALHGGITLAQTGLLTADTDPCMLFGGSSGYISLPTAGLPTGSNSISVECWVSLSSLSSPPNNDAVIINLGLNADLQNIQIDYQKGNQTISFFSWSAGAIRSSVIQVHQAYHLVITYNGTTLTYYMNAIVQGSESLALNLSYGNAWLGTDTASSDWWPGYIDEVAIYPTALSATQVQNHFRAGIGTVNFPVLPLTLLARDGHMTATTRDGLSLTTKTRGNPG